MRAEILWNFYVHRRQNTICLSPLMSLFILVTLWIFLGRLKDVLLREPILSFPRKLPEKKILFYKKTVGSRTTDIIFRSWLATAVLQ